MVTSRYEKYIARKTGTPLIPTSSGPLHFRGDTVPGVGGATIVDLSDIVVDKNTVKLYYNIPVPPDGKRIETVGVLPVEPFGGDRGIRTPDLRDANAALSQLSYIPWVTGTL